MARKSRLTQSDCLYLFRKMAKAQEKILEFVGHGCPKEGFRDDMFLCVELLQLKQIIDDKVVEKVLEEVQ